jgi:transcriptional regulator with XRE-family HTH domain
MAVTRNLAEMIRRKLAADPDLAAAVDAELFNANVGAEIFQARTAAGLTQRQLAERVGMQQSAIARLEDAEYDGHSLKTLERIAFALGKRVEIRFVDLCVSVLRASAGELTVEPTAWGGDWEEWIPRITTTTQSYQAALRGTHL